MVESGFISTNKKSGVFPSLILSNKWTVYLVLSQLLSLAGTKSL
jgi:hypothetical protein